MSVTHSRARLCAAVAILLAFGGICLRARWNKARLQNRIDRIHADGQPTTAAELNSRYTKVASTENAGMLALDAIDGFRDTGGPAPVLDSSKNSQATEAPTPGLLAADAAYLARNAAAISALHAALAHPNSRMDCDLAQGFSAPMAHLGLLRKGADRLRACAEMAARTGRGELAAQCLGDGLRLARTLDREPALISFLVQTTLEAMASRATERVLSITPLAARDLAALQQAFHEADQALSYEGCVTGDLCLNIDILRRPAAEIAKALGENGAITAALRVYCAFGMHTSDLAANIDYLDKLRLTARLPPRQQLAESRQLNAALDRTLRFHFLPLSQMLLPSVQRAPLAALRTRESLRCTEAALAVERWRLDHAGTVPETADQLGSALPGVLREDPFDGKPIRFRRLATGYVVYGVGEDGIDNGGKARVTGQTNGWDQTFTVSR